MRAALAESEDEHEDESVEESAATSAQMSAAVGSASVPGDLLTLLSLGRSCLSTRHVTEALARLSALTVGAPPQLRTAMLAHPALAQCVHDTAPEAFGCVNQLATYMHSCAALGVTMPALPAYVHRALYLVVRDNTCCAHVAALARALAAAGWSDQRSYWCLADHVLRNVDRDSLPVC